MTTNLDQVPLQADQATVEALLAQEQRDRRQRHPWTFTDLNGSWRLVFVAGKQRPGRVRVPGPWASQLFRSLGATLSFSAPETGEVGQVRNQVQIGPLRLQFQGPARFCPGRNVLLFDFTRLELAWGDRTLRQGFVGRGEAGEQTFAETPARQLPLFAFFWIGQRRLAARGKGGGLAVWEKAD